MNQFQNTKKIYYDDIGLSEILQLLIRRLYLLFLAGVIGGTLTFTIVRYFVKPAYQSYVSFYIYSYPDSHSRSDTVSSSDLMAAEKLTATYAGIMSSNSVLDTVIRHMDAPEGLSRNSLRQMIRTSVISNTQLLAVTVTTNDAELSFRIAASFAEAVPDEIIRITKVGSVELVDQPEIAAQPSAPNVFIDSCIGAFTAILLTAAVLVIRMFTDTTIYLPEDISRMTDAAVLGQIPYINDDRKMVSWEKISGGVIRYVRKEES